MQLCFATNNANKLKEVQGLLGKSIELLSLKDIGCVEDIPENERTIEGNSLAKARFVKENYNIDCFADDTGLEVEELDGAPGVYSARYAGEPADNRRNIDKLLNELESTANRSARFKTVVSLLLKNKEFQFEGIAEGEITRIRTGTDGFGYDPVFRPQGFEITFAEMTMKQKGEISHRGKAITKLVDFLANKRK